jgi:hypothetical protein
MKEMKVLITLAGALCVLAFAAGAKAQNEEAVDWDEAIEFADLVDTDVENGTTWETYYDELQNVMWSQPADAPAEAVKAYFSGDQETLEGNGWLDLCIINWPSPDYIIISPKSDPLDEDTYTSFAFVTGGDYLKVWEAVTWGSYDDVDNYVAGRVSNNINYKASYVGYVFDQSIPGWDYADWDDASGTGPYYYPANHNSTVEDWEYPNLTSTGVTGHSFYACDATRNVVLKLTVIEPEK